MIYDRWSNRFQRANYDGNGDAAAEGRDHAVLIGDARLQTWIVESLVLLRTAGAYLAPAVRVYRPTILEWGWSGTIPQKFLAFAVHLPAAASKFCVRLDMRNSV